MPQRPTRPYGTRIQAAAYQLSDEEVGRFWALVNFTADGHQLWTKPTALTAAPTFGVGGEKVIARRLAWFLAGGDAEVSVVRNTCGRRMCIAAAHSIADGLSRNFPTYTNDQNEWRSRRRRD